MTRTANPEQQRLMKLPVSDVLLTAPAGCGKTEALALRVKALVERGLVPDYQKVLAVTFSNRAKANLSERLRSVLGPHFGRVVFVTNLHGLSGRILRAHGPTIGIERDIGFPERGWRSRTMNSLKCWRSRRNADFWTGRRLAGAGSRSRLLAGDFRFRIGVA
jgi:DNA helicase-2/ATP-dependent DNA helicase PcrA